MFTMLRALANDSALTILDRWVLHSHGHGWGGGSGGPSDEIAGYFVVSVLILAFTTTFFSLGGGFLAAFFVRRLRHPFWATPAANFLVYLVMILLRPYPGGFAQRFRLPGSIYLILELVVLLVLSLAWAGLIVLICLAFRGIRRLVRQASEAPPSGEAVERAAGT